MRRSGSILLLIIAAALLGGCVYDPYTGTYYPCCASYGYPYRYPYQYPYSPYYQNQGYYGQNQGYYGQPAPQQPPPPAHP